MEPRIAMTEEGSGGGHVAAARRGAGNLFIAIAALPVAMVLASS